MTALLNRIHARVGDLWWYSAMIFLAWRKTCRYRIQLTNYDIICREIENKQF